MKKQFSYRGWATGLIPAFCLAMTSTPVQANSHLWRINEVFSNADGSVQFIEMLEIGGSNNECNLVSRWFLTESFQYDFPNDLPCQTANRKFLIATQGFADLPGAPTPDFIVPDRFVDPEQDDLLVYFFYDNLYLPKGLLPLDGVSSLDTSDRGNLVAVTNSPTNFAGVSGSIAVAGAPCSLSVTPSYAAGTGLVINFSIYTQAPATWNVWLNLQSNTPRLRAVPLPALGAPIAQNITLATLPQIGTVGVLTTLTDPAGGVRCSDWQTVNTGP